MNHKAKTLRRYVLPASLLATVVLLALLPASASAQAPATGTAALGAEAFRSYCQSCHGPNADGTGPLAEHLTPKPADLTGISQRNDGVFPADKVFAAISGGRSIKSHRKSEMPEWTRALKKASEGTTDEQVERFILNVVEYLRSIQK
jgi:mono/diheme cytochrome c family protein